MTCVPELFKIAFPVLPEFALFPLPPEAEAKPVPCVVALCACEAMFAGVNETESAPPLAPTDHPVPPPRIVCPVAFGMPNVVGDVSVTVPPVPVEFPALMLAIMSPEVAAVALSPLYVPTPLFQVNVWPVDIFVLLFPEKEIFMTFPAMAHDEEVTGAPSPAPYVVPITLNS